MLQMAVQVFVRDVGTSYLSISRNKMWRFPHRPSHIVGFYDSKAIIYGDIFTLARDSSLFVLLLPIRL
jgi:hypothetical protein